MGEFHFYAGKFNKKLRTDPWIYFSNDGGKYPLDPARTGFHVINSGCFCREPVFDWENKADEPLIFYYSFNYTGILYCFCIFCRGECRVYGNGSFPGILVVILKD